MTNTGNGQNATLQGLQRVEREVAPEAVRAAPADNFMAQVQSSLDMLARTGAWLGKLGAHDAKEVHAYVEHRRQEDQQFVADLIARKRQELAELERIMGRLGGNK